MSYSQCMNRIWKFTSSKTFFKLENLYVIVEFLIKLRNKSIYDYMQPIQFSFFNHRGLVVLLSDIEFLCMIPKLLKNRL